MKREDLIQLNMINVPGEFTYEVKEFNENQLKKLDELDVSGFMLAGNLIGIGAEDLKRLEKEEATFVIEEKRNNYVLICQFEDGKIRLLDILEHDKYVF